MNFASQSFNTPHSLVNVNIHIDTDPKIRLRYPRPTLLAVGPENPFDLGAQPPYFASWAFFTPKSRL